MQLQLPALHQGFDTMQLRYGASGLAPIYGAGQISKPQYFFVFMNPTGRNVSSAPSWNGIRAPWLGTKQIWELFFQLNFLSEKTYVRIRMMKIGEWSPEFSTSLYQELADNSVYVTNLAKCTQRDARPLSNEIFRMYRELFMEEIKLVSPERVILFGNQVSSIVLQKQISVSNYLLNESESLVYEGKTYNSFPTYYPVGQGRRNLPFIITRIKSLSRVNGKSKL